MIGAVEHLDLPFRIVVDHDAERPEDRHHAERLIVEVVPDAVFQKRHIDQAVVFRDADLFAEFPDRLGREPPAAHPGQRRHLRVVPAGNDPVFHQFQQLAFAHDRVAQIQSGKFELPRTRPLDQFVQEPIVQRPVVLELQRADRMGDPLDEVTEAVGEVVHRVDAPRIAGPVVALLLDPVDDRIAHGDVRRGHIDLCPEDVRPVHKRTGSHPLEKVQILLDGAVAVGTLFSRLGQRAPVLPHLVRVEVADIGQTFSDELLGIPVELFIVAGGVIEAIPPVETQPFHIPDDRPHVFHALPAGVRVVHAQVAASAVLGGDPEIEADRFRMSDVGVAVRFGRKARGHAPPEFAGFDVVVDDVPDEIGGKGRGCMCHLSNVLSVA